MMEQAISLLYYDHRNSLAYPENLIKLKARPSYQEVFAKPRRGFMMDSPLKPSTKSIEISQKNNKKQAEANKRRNRLVLPQKLSKEEEALMKKYFQGFIAEEKESLQLPQISRSRLSKGETTKAVKSNATVSFYKDTISLMPIQRRRQILERCKRVVLKYVNASIFISRLKKALASSHQRFQQIAHFSTNMNQIIYKLINKYYSLKLLQQPFYEFGQIIKRQILQPNYKPTTEIAQNILSISQCLAESNLRRDVLNFLTLVTLENSPLPNDYFTEFELNRLEFKKKSFMLKNVRDEQVHMVVGVFLGIKIFCNNIFYQPWNIQILNLPKKLDKKVKIVISHYSSFFYTLIYNLYKKLPTHGPRFVKSLENKGVSPMPMVEESSEFHDRLFLDFEPILRKTRANLIRWIERVSNEIVKRRLQYKKTGDLASL